MIVRDLAASEEALLHAHLEQSGASAWRGPFLAGPDGLAARVLAEGEGDTCLVVRRRRARIEEGEAVLGEVRLVPRPARAEFELERGASSELDDAVLWAMATPREWEALSAGHAFELVRTQLKLWARVEDVRLAAAPGVEVELASAFPPEVEELPARIGGAPLPAAWARRDRGWMDWRFGPNAPGNHAIGLARRGAELVGCAVFRRADFDGARGEGLACEWLAPGSDEAVGHALRAFLVERARAAGAERLVTLLPETTPDWFHFQRAGLRVARTGYLLGARGRLRRHDARWLFHHWYYTLADGGLA